MSLVLTSASGQTFAGILPPPALRKVVDKTASTVARSGLLFEQKIRENQRSNPRFAFLNEADLFHPYYQWRYDRELASDPVSESLPSVGPGPLIAAADGTPATSVVRPGQTAATERTAADQLTEPDPHEFLIPDRPDLPAIDLDVIKLTALFTARRSRQFLNALTMREALNPQFNFLRPNHSLFGFFNRLVDQYALVINASARPPQKDVPGWKRSRADVIASVKARAAWERAQRDQLRSVQAQSEADSLAFKSIDWADFVVVETVQFSAADHELQLPLPTTLKQLQNMTLAQKSMAAMIMDEPDAQPSQEASQDSVPLAEPQPTTAQGAPIPAAAAPPSAIPNLPAPANVKIRTDYVPKTIAQLKAQKVTTGISPSGQEVPLDQMAKQVRVETLDPKWREQQAIREAKMATAAIATNQTDVYSSLAAFRAARTDIFGGTEAEEQRKKEAEELAAKKKEASGYLWDGHLTSAGLAAGTHQVSASAMAHQIAAIHARHGLTGEAADVGPSLAPSVPQAGPFLDLGGQGTISADPQAPDAARPAPAIHPSRLQQMGGPNGAALPSVPTSASQTRPADTSNDEAQAPDAKRSRVERTGPLLPEAKWLMMHPEPISLKVQLPETDEKPEWNFKGQILDIESTKLEWTFSTLRDLINKHHAGLNAPNARVQLSHNGVTAKNSNTLASFNLMDGDIILMKMVKKKK